MLQVQQVQEGNGADAEKKELEEGVKRGVNQGVNQGAEKRELRGVNK